MGSYLSILLFLHFVKSILLLFLENIASTGFKAQRSVNVFHLKVIFHVIAGPCIC